MVSRQVARLAHAAGASVLVDNTLLTPSLLQPLTLKTSEEGHAVAADIVIHSATRFLCGHSDAIGGIIVARDLVLADKIRRSRNVYGGVLSPFNCFLITRGITTLSARMRVHSENALADPGSEMRRGLAVSKQGARPPGAVERP